MGEDQSADRDLGARKNKLKYGLRKEETYLRASDREGGEGSDRAESGESDYHPAVDDQATGDDHDGDWTSETLQPMHTSSTGPVEHQVQRSGRSSARPVIIPAQQLPLLLERQSSELMFLREVNKDLLEERIRHNAVLEELSDVKKVKNSLHRMNLQLEGQLEKCDLDNRKLKELNEELSQKMLEFVAEARKGKKDIKDISEINDSLHRELNTAKYGMEAKERTINALKAERERFARDELRCQTLKAEVEKLNGDLMKAREQTNKLLAQQREMANERGDTSVSELESEDTLALLNDEVWRREYVPVRNQEDVEQIPDPIAYSTSANLTTGPDAEMDNSSTGTQTQEPDAVMDGVSFGIQGFTTQTGKGEKRSRKPVETSMSTKAGDESIPDSANKARKPEVSTKSLQTLENSAHKSNLSPSNYLEERVPSTFTDGNGPTLLPRSPITSADVLPSTPRSDSTVIDSEPSPLSLIGRLNSFHDKPSRGPLSSISEGVASDPDPFRTDSPPPRFAENTPERTKARLVGPLGSPIQIPRIPLPGTKHFESNSLLPSQAFKMVDISKRRRRASLQGWSEFRLEKSRFPPAGLNMLHLSVGNGRSQKASKVSADQGSQTETSKGAYKADKRQSGIIGAIQGSAIVWWLLILCLAISTWFNRDDRQLWMQANEITRQAVLGVRDETWAGPSWLAKMSFDAENMLKIDRSRFA